MKKSPLQLDWVSYPTASYEYMEDVEDNGTPIAVDIRAEVTWDVDDQHMASVSIKNRDDGKSPYRFNIVAAAIFTFDLDEAQKHYGPEKPLMLPSIIAVNVCRILFSGAREYVAMMTSRGPRGSVMIEGVVLEFRDIRISSTVEPPRILREVFKIPEDVVRDVEKRAQELSKKKRENTPKKKASPA